MATTTKVDLTVADLRETAPVDRSDLWNWVYQFTGVKIAREAVWPGNQAPFDAFVAQYPGPLRDRPEGPPSVSLILGSRGSGKSFGSAIATHVSSRFLPRFGTRILGGSKDQSRQIYEAIDSAVIEGRGPLGSDAGSIDAFLKESSTYHNGSKIEILAASSKSVRGPHVPSLKLDEVDEIDPSLREGAMGMCMEMRGYAPVVSMTSTWHRLGGPMSELIDRARGGDFPLFSFNAFDVLKRCPEDVSGPRVDGPDIYRDCPQCPLQRWCHRDLQPSKQTGRIEPMAKRSSGHYSVQSLAQKVMTNSLRNFEADYLCLGPKADGLWFKGFVDAPPFVMAEAEYDPDFPVHLAVDSGVFTGAVWFQVKDRKSPSLARVNIFGDYLSEGLSAEANARAILGYGLTLCNGRVDRGSTDPAGKSRNAVGPTVLAEYKRVGLDLQPWPIPSVADGLALIESFVTPAIGPTALIVHPRCRKTINAFGSYRRAKRAGQWMDYPEDPQHPAEDLIDTIRGGLNDVFPFGRSAPKPVRFGSRD